MRAQVRAILWSLLLVAGCKSTSGDSARLVSVTIAPRGAVIGPAGTVGFSITGFYDDGSTRALTSAMWESSLPAVATINTAGTASAKSAGTTLIRAQIGNLRDSTDLIVSANGATGPLRVSTVNRRYFADPSGRVVYLTGSEYWKTIQDNGPTNPPPAFDYSGFLDFLQRHNHNFTRLYMWEQARWSAETSQSHWFSPTLYLRTGPGTAIDGGPKFDVTKINPAFLARVRQRVIDAGARGIYVSVMLFNGWSVGFKGSSTAANPWQAHPFNAANNINGINGDPNGDAFGGESQTLSIPAITALQDSYVKAVVDAVNDLDNVIYEISNESEQSADAWQYHMIDLIRSYEATKPKQHSIGMTVPYPTVPHGTNTDVLSSKADWVSMNGDVGAPDVADGSKVSLLDTDHVCGICGDASWPWKSMMQGHNPLLMDGYDGSVGVGDPKYNPGDPKWEDIRTNMGYARSYALRMDLAHAIPRGDLASSSYCLAVPGSEYLVLLPTGGSVNVNLSSATGSRVVEWFNPATNHTTAGGTVSGGGSVSFTAPFDGMAVLFIHP